MYQFLQKDRSPSLSVIAKPYRQLVIYSDGENIILKPVELPSEDKLSAALVKAKDYAEKEGLTKNGIKTAIKESRNVKERACGKIVVDTNASISAVFLGGIPLKVLQNVTAKQNEINISPETCDEYDDAISMMAKKTVKT